MVLCDENGFGVDGEYSGDNDAQLDLISVLYYWASGGMYVPRADLFNLKPGVIDTVRAAPLGKLFRPENLVNHTRGKTGPKTMNMPTKGLSTNPPAPPLLLPSPKCSSPHLSSTKVLTPAPRAYTSARIIGFCAIWVWGPCLLAVFIINDSENKTSQARSLFRVAAVFISLARALLRSSMGSKLPIIIYGFIFGGNPL